MAVTMYQLLRALVGLESGRTCRSCGEVVPSFDHFGLSEGVCSACRVSNA